MSSPPHKKASRKRTGGGRQVRLGRWKISQRDLGRNARLSRLCFFSRPRFVLRLYCSKRCCCCWAVGAWRCYALRCKGKITTEGLPTEQTLYWVRKMQCSLNNRERERGTTSLSWRIFFLLLRKRQHINLLVCVPGPDIKQLRSTCTLLAVELSITVSAFNKLRYVC